MNRVRNPGEIAVSDVCIGGHLPYEQMNSDGSIERGTLVPMGHPCSEHSTGFVQLGESVRPGVNRIKEEVRYNSRGPSSVSSNAYRGGWDATFGARRAGSERSN